MSFCLLHMWDLIDISDVRFKQVIINNACILVACKADYHGPIYYTKQNGERQKDILDNETNITINSILPWLLSAFEWMIFVSSKVRAMNAIFWQLQEKQKKNIHCHNRKNWPRQKHSEDNAILYCPKKG